MTDSTLGILDDDVWEFRGHVALRLGDPDGAAARDAPVDLRHRAVGIRYHRRLARVGLAADRLVERQLAEQLGAVVAAHLLGPAGAENMALMAAFRADAGRHVLHHAEDRNADLPEPPEALARIDDRDVLRRGDDDGAGHRHFLGERQLDVAGAGGQVDHQVVEVTPARVLQQLLERLRHHPATPDQGPVDADENAYRAPPPPGPL